MKTSKQHEQFDSFELEDHYDFSDGLRCRFNQLKKVPTTFRLDNDVLLFLKKKAIEEHVGYQTLINNLLRDYTKSSTH